MTNYDAIAYGQVALKVIEEHSVQPTLELFEEVMYEVFDLYTEESIHDELLRLIDYECWKYKHDIE